MLGKIGEVTHCLACMLPLTVRCKTNTEVFFPFSRIFFFLSENCLWISFLWSFVKVNWYTANFQKQGMPVLWKGNGMRPENSGGNLGSF